MKNTHLKAPQARVYAHLKKILFGMMVVFSLVFLVFFSIGQYQNSQDINPLPVLPQK